MTCSSWKCKGAHSSVRVGSIKQHKTVDHFLSFLPRSTQIWSRPLELKQTEHKSVHPLKLRGQYPLVSSPSLYSSQQRQFYSFYFIFSPHGLLSLHSDMVQDHLLSGDTIHNGLDWSTSIINQEKVLHLWWVAWKHNTVEVSQNIHIYKRNLNGITKQQGRQSPN